MKLAGLLYSHKLLRHADLINFIYHETATYVMSWSEKVVVFSPRFFMFEIFYSFFLLQLDLA